MKRAVSLLLSITMVLILAACGNPTASQWQEVTSDSASTPSEEVQDTTQKTVERSETPPETIQETDMNTKTLVVYFSCTGTTKSLAEYAAEILGADIYEIVAEEPYTETDLAYYTNGRADQEQSDPDSRPAISGNVDNMDSYSIILIAYPIWHGQAPRIISTFLESYDFSEKTIIPFCTSHSSGIGSSATDLQRLCSDSAKWHEGMRFGAGTSRDTMEEWLSSIGIK